MSLRELAKHLDLSPTTLSLVLNDSPRAQAIPEETKRRILDAARDWNYQPNFLARSLRSQRTHSVGVLAPELSDGYASLVLSGIEDGLMQKGYVCLVTSHRHQAKLIESHSRVLQERKVDGLILLDTPLERDLGLPVVSVSGHRKVANVTNIVVNHQRAAELGLGHLHDLGHRQIAFFRGQSFSSDTETRWEAIRRAARNHKLDVDPALVQQLAGIDPSPQVGYAAMRQILERGKPFTALFAFNDISAYGAIRALQEAGKTVPRDVSVIGFDDITSAAFHIPALTTIKQPLWRMGMLAAETVLGRVAETSREYPELLKVEPELIVRETTSQAVFP